MIQYPKVIRGGEVELQFLTFCACLGEYLFKDLYDRLYLLYGVVVHERDAHNSFVEIKLGLHMLYKRERVEVTIANTDLRKMGQADKHRARLVDTQRRK